MIVMKKRMQLLLNFSPSNALHVTCVQRNEIQLQSPTLLYLVHLYLNIFQNVILLETGDCFHFHLLKIILLIEHSHKKTFLNTSGARYYQLPPVTSFYSSCLERSSIDIFYSPQYLVCDEHITTCTFLSMSLALVH